MINIEDKVTLPERWDELTPQQAIDTVAVLDEFFTEEMSVGNFRLRLLQKLTGYEPDKKRLKKFSDDDLEQVRNNLYMLSEMIRFPLRPRIANPEVIEVFSPELQEALKVFFPFEITNPDWLSELQMVGKILQVEPEMNMDIRKCLIPHVAIKDAAFKGPTFDIDANGVVTTDMLAGEYIDAYEFFHLYMQTRDENYLNSFMSVLYRRIRRRYSTYEAQKRAHLFKTIPMPTKRVVMVWFQSLLEYLAERSPFTILFKRQPKEDGGMSLGIGDTIFSIAGRGYGPKTDVEHFPLQDYFSILLRELVEAVRSMKEMDVKTNKIEEKTGLSAEIIAQI